MRPHGQGHLVTTLDGSCFISIICKCAVPMWQFLKFFIYFYVHAHIIGSSQQINSVPWAYDTYFQHTLIHHAHHTSSTSRPHTSCPHTSCPHTSPHHTLTHHALTHAFTHHALTHHALTHHALTHHNLTYNAITHHVLKRHSLTQHTLTHHNDSDMTFLRWTFM